MFGKNHWKGVDIAPWQLVLLVVVFLAVAAAVFCAVTFVGKKRGKKFERSTRDLTYGAVCLAASYALSFISIYSLPNGGTITPASALPLLIYCYYFGFRKSLVVAVAYSLLQLVQKPYIVSPYSAVFDYLLPYAAFSLAGIFSFRPNAYAAVLEKKKPLLAAHGRFFIGVGLYFVVRYLSHVLAGVLFWSNLYDSSFLIWSGELTGAVAWGYSLTYNALFLVPDTLLAIAAGVAVLCSKTFNRFMASSVAAQTISAAYPADEPQASAAATDPIPAAATAAASAAADESAAADDTASAGTER